MVGVGQLWVDNVVAIIQVITFDSRPFLATLDLLYIQIYESMTV